MRPMLVVFADDWGRHPSSAQHLIRRLLKRYEVVWVNTIATRSPRLDWYTLQRAWQKLRSWWREGRAPSRSHSPRSSDEHSPTVLDPIMWPWFSTRFDRWLNRKLLTAAVERAARSHDGSRILLTTIPLLEALADDARVFDACLYYCVDDFSAWPGLDQRSLARAERRLLTKADVVVTVSENLKSRLAGMGTNSRLITHGVDLKFWQPEAADRASEVLSKSDEKRLVLFWGVVDPRMDEAFVRALSERLEEAGRIVLCGPVQDAPRRISSLAHVELWGAKPYETLPGLAAQADVLIMPYIDAPVTRAMQPLKLKEYLATGKPVVARDLPATRAWADCLDLASSPDAFADAVLTRTKSGLPAAQCRNRRARLSEESWESKARQLEAAIQEALSRRTTS